MKKNLIYTGIIIVMCAVVIWLAVLLAWPAGAVWVPPVSGYDPGVDYMAHMVAAAEDGGEWAMAMGAVYEGQRNAKIKDLGLEYETTDFFIGDNAKAVLEKLRAYIAPPLPEPERVYMGLYWITGYDTCAECCGKTDGITASGVTATAGRTVAASSEFDFGTRLYIDGLGERVVEDRGGAIGGGRLDVVCNDHDECYSITGWHDVWVIVEG